MDIQHLKYFVEVAKQRNFTKASQILLVSQPSMGTQVPGTIQFLNGATFINC